MQLKRAIISFSFLFVYALGFSHSIIPHCHENDGSVEHSAQHEHQHEHHHHGAHEGEDHKHVQHQGHFDDGILDLLICVLNSSDHPASDNSNCKYLPQNTNFKFSAPSSKFGPLALVLVLFFEKDKRECTSAYRPEAALAYLSPPLSSSPHRGPPVVS